MKILISILIITAIYGFVVWLLRKWNNEHIKTP
jgi:Flp pilus assembly pilin Flp